MDTKKKKEKENGYNRDNHIKQIKPDSENQIVWVFPHMWFLDLILIHKITYAYVIYENRSETA